MATEKVRRSAAALAHVLCYAIPFLFLTRSAAALVVIVGTHFVIDRWRLARFVVWGKNQIAPRLYRNPPTSTGYPLDAPPFLAVWLLIVADNIMHVTINAAALRWIA